MKKIKKILFLAFAVTALLFACSDGSSKKTTKPNPILVEEIVITSGDMTLQTGDSDTLEINIFPLDATNKSVTWESSQPGFVSIDAKGTVTAVAPGTSYISAAAKDKSGVYGVITIEVTDEQPVQVDSVTITSGDQELVAGMTVTLDVRIEPADAGNKNLTWTSSNPAVATIDNLRMLQAVSVGEATITATARDGSNESDTITVTVIAGGGGDDKPVDPGDIVEPPDPGEITNGDIVITESSGWLETLFVKWQKLEGAAKYNVYYKGNGINEWQKIDAPLIREYGTYFRADILGLKPDSYDVKVHAVNNSNTEYGTEGLASNIQVVAHDRSGFAFTNGRVPGAYKMDGTPKDGARILYVTDNSKEKVSISVQTDSGKFETRTGVYNIVQAYEKGYEDRPLIFRFIGRVNEKKSSPFSDSQGTINIKGSSNLRPNIQNGMNITFEGVGDDAVAHGWGFRTSRANNVEIRNLGFMLANTTQKDAIELQGSQYIWVHNCDFFYMRAGSASDQKKGDGTLDVKECDRITLSYNHFWDAGKANLLGNGTETPGYLTYHHNWYDYSDSRHPRVRAHQVHIYNNYYVGIGKYGIGATRNSSLFVEGNYFENSAKPMMISMQGTDIAGGGSTFSSEDGGMIKAYNNFMDSATLSKNQYKPYSSSNTVEFDAYVVTNRSDTVPATVKTKKGSFTYSNFDQVLPYTYIYDDPQTAKENVKTWAGRYWGGDFTWTFNTSDQSHTDDPMPALMTALNNYTSKLVKVQGEAADGTIPQY